MTNNLKHLGIDKEREKKFLLVVQGTVIRSLERVSPTVEGDVRSFFTLFHPPSLSLLGAQRAKKVVSDSPGLVDFVIGLVNSVLNLPDGQVKFSEEEEL